MKKIALLILLALLLNTTITLAAPVGDLKINLSIRPAETSIPSGKSAMFTVTLKVTGIFARYQNASLVISLPLEQYTAFTQDVNELALGGTIPAYDPAARTLTYAFGTLEAGQALETVVKVDTQNGMMPDGTELTVVATLTADGLAPLAHSASVEIEAQSSITISKSFLHVDPALGTFNVPHPGARTLWEIKVAIPKAETGQLYLDEGSVITVTDTLPGGLQYDSMDLGDDPAEAGNQLIWTFAAPSLAAQEAAADLLFEETIRVWLQIPNDLSLVNIQQTNKVQASATLVDGSPLLSNEVLRNITVRSSNAAAGNIPAADWWPATHFGPPDGKGNFNTDVYNLDPNPDVTDQALLVFTEYIVPQRFPDSGVVKFFDYEELNIVYEIDSNLILKEFVAPGDWRFRPNYAYLDYFPLAEPAEYNIHLTVNGVEQLYVANAESKLYTRKMLGLADTDEVSSVRLEFTKAPAGMFDFQLFDLMFYVKPGTLGQVTNKVIWYGQDRPDEFSAPVAFHVDFDPGHPHQTYNAPRHATVVPPGGPWEPVGKIDIELLDHHNGEVAAGDSRVKVTLSNLSGDEANLNKPLQAAVLLPAGVELAGAPNEEFIDADGRSDRKREDAAGGQLTLADPDYN